MSQFRALIVHNRESMADDFTELLNRCVYNVEHILKSALASLIDDLTSENENTAELAERTAEEILDWLAPSPKRALSAEEKLRRIQEIVLDEKMPVQAQLSAVAAVNRSTGRRRGRPRSETAQQAIRAFSLHLATPMSWREIALHVKGCNHGRPNPERSCVPCGDAIRDAVGRLEAFLRSKGYHFTFSRRIDLDRMSTDDLKRFCETPGE